MWEKLRAANQPEVLDIADLVWLRQKEFIRWPRQALVFIPGCVKPKGKEKHRYTTEQRRALREANLRPDVRSNGPAIMAFRLAGGERPVRTQSNDGWNIHHIYDGKFPAPGRSFSTHSVKDGRYFTASAGLAAVHPVAEALAHEVPHFAWLLRHEAYARFGFDPDGVFGDGTLPAPPSLV